MAFTTNQSAQIYWDEQGKGEPLLMIMGMAYASALWHRIRPGQEAVRAEPKVLEILRYVDLTPYYVKRLERLGHKVTLEATVAA
jgi:hypothetical protein